MKKEEYIATIIRAFPNIPDDDAVMVKIIAEECHTRGFTIHDAIQYTGATEYTNPLLDEDIAIARMKEISAKYTCTRLI